MLRRVSVVIAPLLTLSLMLAGCGGNGVASGPGLATVPARPTNTPVPTPTPEVAALPQQAAVAFFDTTAGFELSGGVDDRQQAHFVATLPDDAYPNVGVAVLLESDAAQANPLSQAARPLFYSAGRLLMDFDSQYGAASAPDTERAITFTWGGYEAAAFAHVLIIEPIGLAFASLHVAVQVSDSRFVLWWATGYEWNWAELAPHAAAMLATATLDGEPLPAEDLDAALADMLIGPELDVQATLDARPSATPRTRSTLAGFDDAAAEATVTAAPGG